MTLTSDVFVPVLGYEGLYELSSSGQVRSLDRAVYCGRGARTNTRVIAGRMMKPVKDGVYYKYTLRDRDGKSRRHSIHRLVGTHFLP